MKSLLTSLVVCLFSLNSLATIGVYCSSGDGAEATTVNVPQLPMTGEITNWTYANEIMLYGVPVVEYGNPDHEDVPVKIVESWCDWNNLDHPGSCMMWVKVDINNNGKFEMEFEVKGVLPASENPDEEVTLYKGKMIDYMVSGQKTTAEASCEISP